MFCDYRFNISLSFSIIPLITLILIIIIRFRYKTDYDLRKISMNWDLDLIIDIKIEDNICPNNYESLLEKVKIPKIMIFCDCSSSEKYKGKIFEGQCEKKHGDEKCKQFNSIKETKVDKWREKKICVKRKYFNYMNYIYNENNCEKKCGKLDSHNNILCVKKDEECPINKLQIRKIENKKNIYDINESIISLNKDYELVFSSNENSNDSLIIQIDISQDNKTCSYINEGNLIQSNNVFSLIKGESNCSSYSSNYNIIDSNITLNNFLLNQTNFPKFIFNSEVFNKYSKETSINLNSINYFWFNKEDEKCLEYVKNNGNNFIKIQDKYSLNGKFLSLIIFSIITLIWGCILTDIFMKKPKKKNKKQGFGVLYYPIFIIGIEIILYFLFLITYIIFLISYSSNNFFYIIDNCIEKNIIKMPSNLFLFILYGVFILIHPICISVNDNFISHSF